MNVRRIMARALGSWNVIAGTAWAESDLTVDRETMDRWSAPYRGWR